MEIPPISVRRLRVTKEDEVGVFGYFARRIDSIVNVSGRRITCSLVVGPLDHRFVCLDDGETYAIGLDAETWIRTRFMPYIRTSETVDLDVVWHHWEDDQGGPYPETPA